MSNQLQEVEVSDNILHGGQMMLVLPSHDLICITRGGGTGEAGEATASPELRDFTAEKFLASWMYESGNFSCFTGKKLIPPPLANDCEILLGCVPFCT